MPRVSLRQAAPTSSASSEPRPAPAGNRRVAKATPSSIFHSDHDTDTAGRHLLVYEKEAKMCSMLRYHTSPRTMRGRRNGSKLCTRSTPTLESAASIPVRPSRRPRIGRRRRDHCRQTTHIARGGRSSGCNLNPGSHNGGRLRPAASRGKPAQGCKIRDATGKISRFRIVYPQGSSCHPRRAATKRVVSD